MDKCQQSLDTINRFLPQAQLLIGQRTATHTHVHTYLQQFLCAHQGCGSCTICYSIANHTHHALTWIAPEERYTLDTLAPLAQAVAFTLDNDQKHFIVIDRADTLTPACANSLLKILEEPPRGYHFLVLAQSADRVIPTIRSRCVLTQVTSLAMSCDHPLLACFLQFQPPSPTSFAKLLDTTKITEQETADLLDQLLHFLLLQTKEACINNNITTYKLLQPRLSRVKALCSNSIPPGSSKFVWRELFLQFYQ